MKEAKALIANQRRYFKTQTTKPYAFRLDALKKLKASVKAHEKDIADALWKDLRNSEFESYISETGYVLNEISYAIRNLKKWMKVEKPSTPLALFPSRSRIIREPYGIVLIVAPWNYPFQLLISPLIGAIAAGNCAVLKPSPQAPNVVAVLTKIITGSFDPKYIAITEADNSVTDKLLAQRFDYIFFTGSVEYGKHVMRAASENLTPVTLELGGKSPCIVDKDADLAIAAQRIVWGKFLNAGQTCIAPDYLLVHEKVKSELLSHIKEEIKRQFGDDPQRSPDYPRIVNEAHFSRLVMLMRQGDVITGGASDEKELYISPTVIDNAESYFDIMKEEIFGPLLPVIGFKKIKDAVKFVTDREKPLALYYFTTNRQSAKNMIYSTSSGGACINDVIVHVGSLKLPFGGVGNSGIGNYRGKYTFNTFSHVRSVIISRNKPNFKLKLAPYNGKIKLVRMLLK